MHEFTNDNRPKYVSLSEDGSQCVLIRNSESTYYKPASHWELSDGLLEGKHIAIKSEAWQLDHLIGTQLYPSTYEQFIEDNRGYVCVKRSDTTDDGDDIPF